MKYHVVYTAQLKLALGHGSELVESSRPLTVTELLELLSERYGETFRKAAWSDASKKRTALLVCVGNRCLGSDLSMQLCDGDEVTLLSPVSGG